MPNAKLGHGLIVIFWALWLSACQGGQSEPPPAATEPPVMPTVTPPPEQPTAATSETVLAIRPADDGDETALEIWVERVSGFYALDLQLQFAPESLNIVDGNEEQAGLQFQIGEVPVPDFVVTNEIDPTAGTAQYIVTQIAPRTGFDGDGLVAKILLTELPREPVTLDITTAKLVGEEGQRLPVSTSQITLGE